MENIPVLTYSKLVNFEQFKLPSSKNATFTNSQGEYTCTEAFLDLAVQMGLVKGKITPEALNASLPKLFKDIKKSEIGLKVIKYFYTQQRNLQKQIKKQEIIQKPLMSQDEISKILKDIQLGASRITLEKTNFNPNLFFSFGNSKTEIYFELNGVKLTKNPDGTYFCSNLPFLLTTLGIQEESFLLQEKNNLYKLFKAIECNYVLNKEFHIQNDLPPKKFKKIEENQEEQIIDPNDNPYKKKDKQIPKSNIEEVKAESPQKGNNQQQTQSQDQKKSQKRGFYNSKKPDQGQKKNPNEGQDKSPDFN